MPDNWNVWKSKYEHLESSYKSLETKYELLQSDFERLRDEAQRVQTKADEVLLELTRSMGSNRVDFENAYNILFVQAKELSEERDTYKTAFEQAEKAVCSTVFHVSLIVVVFLFGALIGLIFQTYF